MIAIIRRYSDEPEAMDQKHVFYGEPVAGQYNIIVIGIFNAFDKIYEKTNDPTRI